MAPKIIVGTGRHAAEVFSMMEDLDQNGSLVAFAKDRVEAGESFLGKPVWSVDQVLNSRHMEKPQIMVAIGDVRSNKRISELFRAKDFEFFNLIANGITLSRQRHIGTGVYIGVGSILTVNVSLGDNVIINTGCIVSHDCTIGNYVNISPGSKLAGGVTIEDGVFVGIGATFIPNVRIGGGSVIAAGACVTTDVPSNCMVAGVPAIVKKYL
jgi:acetyltransferase EpsM